jgi:hypothetical protein
MRRWLVGLALLWLVLPGPANAHVLVPDATKTTGAVLHITPDDDPVIGEPSQLFFDIQRAAATSQTHAFTVKIVNDRDEETVVPIQVNGNAISAAYSFPYAAVYSVQLIAEPLDTTQPTLRFVHAQRVTRGGTGLSESKAHTWAEAGLWASLVTTCALMIVGYNHRKEIIKRAKKGS